MYEDIDRLHSIILVAALVMFFVVAAAIVIGFIVAVNYVSHLFI